MKSELTQKWALPPGGLRFFIILLLVLGVFFRFVHLDRKVYWGDEAYTSLRIAGYKWTDLAPVLDGREIGIEDLQKYQRTNSERGLIDTIDSLAVEDPHHPPLYYVIGRFWMQWFGNSVAVIRSSSALISLLVFPCTYWLCLELFESSLTGWVAIALLAISPFHLLYAQEAREYSLWTVTILLSSAALLRAMRVKTKLSWGIYSVALALSLYTFLFSALVAIGHGIYVLAIESFRLSKRVTAYVLASIAGIILFAPWLFIVITNVSRIQATNTDKIGRVSLFYLFDMWASNLSRVFVDVPLGDEKILLFLIPPTLILVGYSIYFLCLHTPKAVWLFILTLIGTTSLALILPDVILGGSRSIGARYLIPCYLGIELAVAYLLSTQMVFFSVKVWSQKVWHLVMIALVSGGVLSCARISQADTWWNKYGDSYNPAIARIVNQSPKPLLIADSQYRVLSLSYLLDNKVRLKVGLNNKNSPLIPDGFSDIFVFNTFSNRSRGFQELIEKEQKGKLELVYKKDMSFKKREISLWKLIKL